MKHPILRINFKLNSHGKFQKKYLELSKENAFFKRRIDMSNQIKMTKRYPLVFTEHTSLICR